MGSSDDRQEDYRRNVCDRLRQLRIDAGYQSQAEFAEEIGISANTYSKYENRSLIPHRLIPLVCEMLNCSSWYYLTGQPSQHSPPFTGERHRNVIIKSNSNASSD